MACDNGKNTEFMASLLKEILEDVYQYHEKNIDVERFRQPSQKRFLKRVVKKIRNKIFASLNGKIFYKGSFSKNDIGNIETLGPYFKGLTDLYNLLGDQYSKSLLIKVIAYRILGNERVKLPLNTADYWGKRKFAQSLVTGNDQIPISFMNWKLSYFALDRINYPIRLFSSPMAICAIFMIKNYEYRESSTLIKAERGDVVIEAGGCWGDTALYFAHEVGDEGKVYSFEFIPSNLEIMMKNIHLNAHLKPRIEIVKNPVWDETGDIFYFIDTGPGSKVSKEKIDNDSAPVSTITIDDYVKKENLQRVDFIKMDIEGAELNALAGSKNTLMKFKPKLAISLYHNLGDFETIPAFLKSLNLDYEFYLGHYTIHAEETVLFAKARRSREKGHGAGCDAVFSPVQVLQEPPTPSHEISSRSAVSTRNPPMT